MTTEQPTSVERALTGLVVVLSVVFFVWGVAHYGLSADVHERFWSDIFGRADGPMTFRFFLQPAMATIAAIHDGLRDVREGHKSFFWTAMWDPSQPAGRLREGLNSTARIMLLGLGMDVIYQNIVFDQFYPVEALTIAILLAVVPYFIIRWLVERIVRQRASRPTGRDV